MLIFTFLLLIQFIFSSSNPLNFDGINQISDPSQKSNLPLAVDSTIFNESEKSPPGFANVRHNVVSAKGKVTTNWITPLGNAWFKLKLICGEYICEIAEDDIVFMWHKHNGRSFGSQQIVDDDLEMSTDWFNFGWSSWMTRLNLTRPNWENGPKAVILYFALQDIVSSLENTENSFDKNGEINFLNGQSPAIGGKFAMKIRMKEEKVDISKLAMNFDPFLDMAKIGEIIKSKLKMQPNGNYAFEINEKGGEKPNFVALQINIKGNNVLDILFEKEGDLVPSNFENGFKEKEAIFQTQFEAAFLISKNYPPIYHKMGQAALSNLLGGIGVWHGNMRIRSAKFDPPFSTKVYGPNSLISAVPSRTGFPRGFLWDEGHHNLLIHKFDPSLSLEIIGAYLDLMNIDGWIPREIALGSEAEARIPADFITQEDWVANPPTFFLVLREFMANDERTQQYSVQLKRLYPRMKQLYIWLRESQKGPLLGTFRWHGRNGTTKLMLNPGALDSGLDDYPRASHPTEGEYHIDLLAWMAMASSVLENLAEFAEDVEFLPKIRKEAAHLNDIGQMDKLHWSERAQQYCDFGLHSDAVDLVEMKVGGENLLVRRVLLEPEYKLVENVNGYANLFPLLILILPANSPRLAKLLEHMADPQQLWTPFGLRSISTWSPYYGSWNDKFAAPYWRGPIWINLNYYAITALKHYSSLKGPYQEESARLYAELRTNLLKNMADQYAKTGFIWEHYNDLDGHGGGNHPFTGWSALVLAILAENY